MQFSTATLFSVLTALAAAAPAPQLPEVNDPDYFGLLAIRSGNSVHLSSFNAAKSSIFAGLTGQNATCDTESTSATFYIQDEGLFLYAASATPQQLFVDRSGMGQGKLGYTTGAQPAPTNSERTGFAITNGSLTFDGAGFIACPNSIAGSHSIWVSAGIENPAGNQNCTTIGATVIEATTPVSCIYTE